MRGHISHTNGEVDTGVELPHFVRASNSTIGAHVTLCQVELRQQTHTAQQSVHQDLHITEILERKHNNSTGLTHLGGQVIPRGCLSVVQDNAFDGRQNDVFGCSCTRRGFQHPHISSPCLSTATTEKAHKVKRRMPCNGGTGSTQTRSNTHQKKIHKKKHHTADQHLLKKSSNTWTVWSCQERGQGSMEW